MPIMALRDASASETKFAQVVTCLVKFGGEVYLSELASKNSLNLVNSKFPLVSMEYLLSANHFGGCAYALLNYQYEMQHSHTGHT